MGCKIARVAIAALLLAAPNPLSAVEAPDSPTVCAVIPKPVKMERAEGAFTLTGKTAIGVGSPELAKIGRYLAELAAPATGFELAIEASSASEGGRIALKLDASQQELGDEGYKLVCTPGGVTITAASPAGVFYGVQTLRQLLPAEIENRQKVEGVAWTVPCVAIEDRPRFPWRGYLIDPARHFRTKEELKRYIDLLALQKLNRFQIHLTDDQGWRIEIKKYPKLVEIGSRLPNISGKTGEGWFYTQDDIRELVEYAEERYVTIVPEIEMPGHSRAATKSYSHLACGGVGFSSAICASQESTREYARDVLNEVMELFPSKYIHIGADEVPHQRWRGCKSCAPMMRKLAETTPDDVLRAAVKLIPQWRQSLPDIALLQGDFVRHIDEHVSARGRRLVGWDEILDGGLKKGSSAVVMAWRPSDAISLAASQKREVVASMHPDCYLDQNVPLERTYLYEPIPAEMPPEAQKYVIGIQGNMWGEGTPTIELVDQRSFPRLCALAETGWTTREGRDFTEFSDRLARFCKRLDVMGVDYGK